MKFRLFDTAGLKLNRKTNSSLDYLSSVRTRKAIGGSDVVFLVLDAMEGVADLDKRLAGEIVEAGAAAIIVVNKWDYAAETFKSAPLRGYENLAAFKRDSRLPCAARFRTSPTRPCTSFPQRRIRA